MAVSIPPLPPTTLEDALAQARAMLTDEDRAVLRSLSEDEAGWRLHLTLGHALRNGLGLWRDEAGVLFQDIMDKVPEAFPFDTDSVSSVLIKRLWREQQGAEQ